MNNFTNYILVTVLIGIFIAMFIPSCLNIRKPINSNHDNLIDSLDTEIKIDLDVVKQAKKLIKRNEVLLEEAEKKTEKAKEDLTTALEEGDTLKILIAQDSVIKKQDFQIDVLEAKTVFQDTTITAQDRVIENSMLENQLLKKDNKKLKRKLKIAKFVAKAAVVTAVVITTIKLLK